MGNVVKFSVFLLFLQGKNSYLSHRIVESFPRNKDEKLKHKASFVYPEGPNAQANRAGINFVIFILIFVENCL